MVKLDVLTFYDVVIEILGSKHSYNVVPSC